MRSPGTGNHTFDSVSSIHSDFGTAGGFIIVAAFMLTKTATTDVTMRLARIRKGVQAPMYRLRHGAFVAPDRKSKHPALLRRCIYAFEPQLARWRKLVLPSLRILRLRLLRGPKDDEKRNP
jgi:hypothetical protein